MTEPNPLMLDANIMVRGAYGIQVRGLIGTYAKTATFYSPDVCFDDARRHITRIAKDRHIPAEPGLRFIDEMSRIVRPVPIAVYAVYETEARLRIGKQDPNDWPIVAAALLMNCPVWTEDYDFFGCGVATWNCRNVEIYFRGK